MDDTGSEFLHVYETLRLDIDRVLHPDVSEAEIRNISQYGTGSSLTQSQRRTVVRGIFALAEATCYFLRVRLLETDGKNSRLTFPQRLALAEQQVEVLSTGIVSTKTMRCSTIVLIKMTFEGYVDYLKGDFVSPCSQVHFEALVRSIKVRDRLMHPKSVTHLEVTNTEMQDAVAAFQWLNVAVLTTVRAHIAFMVSERTKVEMQLALQNSIAPLHQPSRKRPRRL